MGQRAAPPRPSRPSRRRRGNYTVLFAVLVVVLLGFGALGVDVTYLRLAESQTQDVADAASQAALIVLRQTGDRDMAEVGAASLVSRNRVVGGGAVLRTLEAGTWADGVFTPSDEGEDANAIRAVVGREVPMILGPFFDWTQSDVQREAVSASRAVHALLVIDIGNSWDQDDFAKVREASVAFLDVLAEAAGPDDRIGMVTFVGRYAVEQTPLMTVDDAVAVGLRDDWSNDLFTASRAGVADVSQADGCNTHAFDDFSSPSGGCFPTMWRQYSDEAGTDHSVGLEYARTLFAEHPGDDVYRVVILVTDDNPSGFDPALNAFKYQKRAAAGYVEDRFRYFFTPKSRSPIEVALDTRAVAQDLHATYGAHIWTLTYDEDATWLEFVKQGDGYAFRAATPVAFPLIFEDIAESLPLVLVR